MLCVGASVRRGWRPTGNKRKLAAFQLSCCLEGCICLEVSDAVQACGSLWEWRFGACPGMDLLCSEAAQPDAWQLFCQAGGQIVGHTDKCGQSATYGLGFAATAHVCTYVRLLEAQLVGMTFWRVRSPWTSSAAKLLSQTLGDSSGKPARILRDRQLPI